MPHDMVLYPNTTEMAERIGWSKVAEHVVGDPASQFVLHLPSQGKFVYIDVERTETQ